MRPLHHFTPSSGWMNDPNGLIFHKGLWRLFYQHIPQGGEGLHWGLATSPDLLNWQDCGPVLFPQPLGEIWSGSAIEVEGRLASFFTLRLGADGSRPEAQRQGAAWSDDGGLTWTQDPRNPLVESAKSDFRDPKVLWDSQSDQWIMVVAAAEDLEFFGSLGLGDWQLLSTLSLPEAKGLVWECPDLFPCPGGEGWILTASLVNPAPDRTWAHRSVWMKGQLSDGAFQPEGGLKPLSAGPDDYAAITFAQAPESRRILVGWMNSWLLGPHIAPLPWQGQMTCPREVWWNGESLCQGLTPEWASLPDDPAAGEAWKLDLPAGDFSLTLLKGDQEILHFRREKGQALLTRTRWGLPLWKERREELDEMFLAPTAFPSRGGPGQGVVDRCSFEAFLDDGEASFFAQVYPPEGAWSIRWDSLG